MPSVASSWGGGGTSELGAGRGGRLPRIHSFPPPRAPPQHLWRHTAAGLSPGTGQAGWWGTKADEGEWGCGPSTPREEWQGRGRLGAGWQGGADSGRPDGGDGGPPGLSGAGREGPGAGLSVARWVDSAWAGASARGPHLSLWSDSWGGGPPAQPHSPPLLRGPGAPAPSAPLPYSGQGVGGKAGYRGSL